MRHLMFQEDKTRVAYILSHLRGGPSEWGLALLEAESPLLKDYKAFLARFTAIYQNPERLTQLEDKLACMEQKGSASAFAAEFTAI